MCGPVHTTHNFVGDVKQTSDKQWTDTDFIPQGSTNYLQSHKNAQFPPLIDEIDLSCSDVLPCNPMCVQELIRSVIYDRPRIMGL